MGPLMRLSDYVGMVAFSAFGLWWLAFPASVIRFYTWFHRGTVQLPKSTSAIRVLGLILMVLVVSVTIWGRRI
jgi:succinate-acetate transporter protein